MNFRVRLENFLKKKQNKLEHDTMPNGHSCPDCGYELNDKHYNIILTSNPPMKEVICTNPLCNYTGYRFIS